MPQLPPVSLKSPDRILVRAIINRNQTVTRDFFYRKCYPLFKSVFDNYHTDCESCLEFINEIYIHVMSPDKQSGKSKLESFEFRSTLFTWLKTVCLFYCYKIYKRKERQPLDRLDDKFFDRDVRLSDSPDSISYEEFSPALDDAETILRLMPNRRYSQLIRLRYLEDYSNEETALKMGMNMNTFYNKHKLAKDQFIKTLRKEESRPDCV